MRVKPGATPLYLRVARIIASYGEATLADLMTKAGHPAREVENALLQLRRRGEIMSRRARSGARYKLTVPIERIEARVGQSIPEVSSVPLLERCWPARMARQVAEIGVAGG